MFEVCVLYYRPVTGPKSQRIYEVRVLYYRLLPDLSLRMFEVCVLYYRPVTGPKSQKMYEVCVLYYRQQMAVLPDDVSGRCVFV